MLAFYLFFFLFFLSSGGSNGNVKGMEMGDGHTALMRTHRIKVKRVQLVGMFNHPPRLVAPLSTSSRSRDGTGERSGWSPSSCSCS